MQSPRSLTSSIAALLVALAAAPATAATALFDFENQPIPTETPFALSDGGVTAIFSGPANVDPGAFGIASNYPTPTGYQYRLMNGDFLTIGSAFGASGSALSIGFSAPVTGFSLNFGLDDPADASTLSFTTSAGGAGSVGAVLVSGYRYPEGTLSFAGAAFTELTLRSNAIDFQIDDLRVGTVSAVPEPANLLLLCAGLPALWQMRRRQRRSPLAT